MNENGLTSYDLFTAVAAGEASSAQMLHDRYLQRLISMVRQRIAPRLQARLDAEDVVQSAFRSFFFRAREGRFVIERAGDLWRLLAQIAIHKLRRQVEFQSALKRSPKQEVRQVEDAQPLPAWKTPTPDEAASLLEMMTQFFAGCSETERRILELRLHGDSIEQISHAVERSQRTVRRVLQSLEERLAKQLGADSEAEA